MEVADGRALTDGDADTDGAGVAVAEGCALAAGDTLVDGDALTEGAEEAEGVTVGVVLMRTVGEAVAVGATEAVTAGVAVAAGIVAVAVGLAGGAEALGVLSGFTNRFDGASGGGVDSVFIFARALSAAERSEISLQPLSTSTRATLSLTFRGRSIPGSAPMSGVGTSISSPCTVARAVSPLISRCRRSR